jgi:integrase
MAQIEIRLLNKIQKETGLSEVKIVLRYSKHDLYAKSGIWVNPSFFEYYIDRKKTTNPLRPFPENKNTTTLEKAKKNGWALRNSGIIVYSSKSLQTPQVIYHNEQWTKMEELKKVILDAYNKAADKDNLTSDWLVGIVHKFHHPEKNEVKDKKKTFYELSEEFLTKPHGKQTEPLAESHARVYRVLLRAVARYEGFVRATDKSRKKWTWDINTITKEVLEDFFDYLRNEKELSEDYPNLFKKLLEQYPPSVKAGNKKIEERGGNTVIKMKTRLKTLFRYFYDMGYTTNRPFEGITIGAEKVGTPVYITISERNKIADADLTSAWNAMSKEDQKKARMPLKTLMEQRDIFVFHCLIGCRVSDLIKLNENNIDNGILIYTPHKTKDFGEEQVQARVPLHQKAIELIKQYKGKDTEGRLFPFITPQRYNDALKVIFKLAGITRKVEVRNPLTGENEFVPIDTIASSHMARRTFIGNAYFKVQDPNLIGKMSGHVEGSSAFTRYRKIEDATLKEVIDLMG